MIMRRWLGTECSASLARHEKFLFWRTTAQAGQSCLTVFFYLLFLLLRLFPCVCRRNIELNYFQFTPRQLQRKCERRAEINASR